MINHRTAIVLVASLAAIAACSSDPIDNSPDASGGSGNDGSGGASGLPSGGNTGLPSGGGSGLPSGGNTGLPSGGGSGLPSGGSTASGGGDGSGGEATSGDGDGSGGGGTVTADEGPCDIYNEAGNECVAAYSTIRRLLSTYDGPLYQVRSNSSTMNTGNGGMTHDIPQNAEGFADKAAVDTACGATTCTVSKLYDQSGRGNDLTVAKAGLTNGGMYAGMDDFETSATKGGMSVGGHDVYSLYMEARQGYRLTARGDGVPYDKEPQGLYMLADGTHAGAACCWDFGNVTPNPKSYAEMNTLMLGIAYWGKGAGEGPWYGADFEAGVWMGGSNVGDPGWGGLDASAAQKPPNPNNPSMKGVKFALGFLKTTSTPVDTYALRMANLATATEPTTAYKGNYPTGKHIKNMGAVVIGVGGDNSNNSWGTFYEGAVVQGYPDDATENAVMQNLKDAGYLP